MTGAACAGLLLAAGAGRRFGRPKALVALNGELLVERGARMLQESGCAPVVVVVGAAADQVRRRARLAAAEVVANPRWTDGQSASLQAGLQALTGRAAAVVVALADQPLISAAAVRRLIAAWRSGAEVAVATYQGQPRNPVLLAASVWEDVARSTEGDQGARLWLRDHPDRVTPVPCEDVAAPADVDTPADLARLTAPQEESCS